MTGRRYCVLAGSGTASLVLILRALARLSPERRTEVVMPAYTAPSLVLALRAAGMAPVLCDISLRTFNQDLERMAAAAGERTLAVMPVHMYGLAEDLAPLENALRTRGVFVIEDAASAMGSACRGRMAGSMGDVSFFSFNRGKNLSTVSGGAVLTDNPDIHEAVVQETGRLDSVKNAKRAHLVMKAFGLSLIWRPALYALLWPIANGYRYGGLHEKISLASYTEFQAGIGCALMARRRVIFGKRRGNGDFLHERLSVIPWVTVPSPGEGSSPAFNQFPVLIEQARRSGILGRLRGAGIEATTLYPRPIHRIYGLAESGGNDPFPCATEMAGKILLLPVHPGVRRKDLEKMASLLGNGS
jgi:dTDP-4-amino-4,6-dideoxygalactose transaminase